MMHVVLVSRAVNKGDAFSKSVDVLLLDRSGGVVLAKQVAALVGVIAGALLGVGLL